MKKMLTTLMVLALMATAATAFAGDTDWSFYGKLHSSINMLGNGENSQLGLTSNTSRFGFKGSAPMNDSFTFVWQFERGINIAQSSTTLAARNTYVGFKSAKLGEVRMGIHDTPHKTLGRKATFFYDTVGDNRQMTFDTDTREQDILAWVSPNWSGFGLFLAYQFDQDDTKLDSGAAADAEFNALTLFSGMATYSKDNFMVGASWIMASEGYADVDDDGNFGDSPMVLRFAGKYDAEQFGLAASYLTVGQQYWDGAAFQDLTSTTFGVEAIFHANEKYDVKGAYYMADPNTDFDDDDFGLLTFGIDRNFSKSLQMYVQYAMLSNGDAADATLGATNGFGTTLGGWENEDGQFENPYGLSWGLAYKW